MKISKLFHWLYALLMLLPFAFFVPSVLYYAFNDNSTMQTVEVPVMETVAVDFNQQITDSVGTWSIGNDDLVLRKNGTLLGVNGTWGNGGSTQVAFDFYTPVSNHVYLVRFDHSIQNYGRVQVNDYYENGTPRARFFFEDGTFVSTNEMEITSILSIYFNPSQNITYSNYNFYLNLFDLTKMFGAGNEPSISEFNQIFPRDYYDYVLSKPMQVTYDTGETEQLIANTDIINYAWESIWDLPLFNWCKVSFVAIPFSYITGLFGLSASNSFNYVFTYFASMSIIWLVFDVILYVPLLVHRWLDKGIVE